jgi:hypothetical protein
VRESTSGSESGFVWMSNLRDLLFSLRETVDGVAAHKTLREATVCNHGGGSQMLRWSGARLRPWSCWKLLLTIAHAVLFLATDTHEMATTSNVDALLLVHPYALWKTDGRAFLRPGCSGQTEHPHGTPLDQHHRLRGAECENLRDRRWRIVTLSQLRLRGGKEKRDRRGSPSPIRTLALAFPPSRHADEFAADGCSRRCS